MNSGTPTTPETRPNFVHRLAGQPRIVLLMLAGWSVLTALSQLFVNSDVFLDIHGMELDGALGGLALSFNSVPLAVLYLYCARSPERYAHIFWLALIHQATMAAGVVYQWVIGTFSPESIIVPLIGSLVLAALAFVQVFTPRVGPPATQG